MLVQITVRVDGREVGSLEREVSGTAAEMEEDTRVVLARIGRMVLESAFAQIGEETPRPSCCVHAMKNCGCCRQFPFREVIVTVHSLASPGAENWASRRGRNS